MLFFINFEKKFNLFRKSRNNKLILSNIKKVNLLKQVYKNITKIQEKTVNY